ncbi:MAG: tryptophan synthase subunit beta [candidate division Zixibacteria bacterium]|nr:tryptophan synthase subunit beta [candidate division Zixibacteria bacterium]
MVNEKRSSASDPGYRLAPFLPRPDRRGRFGAYGGRYVPETLIPALKRLEADFKSAWKDPAFQKEYRRLMHEFAGRPTSLYFAERLSSHWRRGRIYLKREDLNHTGSHKLNNTLGQILLAVRGGKKRVIAETGAGQHGVATATVAARFGLECDVYMGKIDVERQAPNVARMKLLGARVIPVESGAQTLKDATNEAIRDWVARVDDTFYVIGSVVGPHPYPFMVRQFQRVIGEEARTQFKQQIGRLPNLLVACVGGGSNALGFFTAFMKDKSVRMLGVEAAGCGLHSGKHAASLSAGRVGILHGSAGYLLQSNDGQITVPQSISAGLDYPGVGPEHSYLKDSRRVTYTSVTDDEALAAFTALSELEGILPALESAHALAAVRKLPARRTTNQIIGVCLSGRGDKDLATVMEAAESGGGGKSRNKS